VVEFFLMEQYFIDLSVLILATVVLSYILTRLKQPLIVAYIITGALIGPWGLKLIKEIDFISLTSHLGIIFLLFLAGLVLHPQKLLRLFREVFWVTLLVSLSSFLTAFGISLAIGNFSVFESFLIGICLMFSSTVLTIKLLPTTKLHHKKIGAVCIGVLILQDILAVLILAFIHVSRGSGNFIITASLILLKIAALFIGAVLFEKYIFRHIIRQVERVHEMIFIFALGWCFSNGWLAYKIGLSFEIGAFIAGVVLARHPISLFISERLKPLRDFFLLLFFFSLGAKINFPQIIKFLPQAFLLAGVYILVKPFYFRKALEWKREQRALAKEAGMRLGQASEFSLLIAFSLLKTQFINDSIFNFIEIVTVLTFIFSSYIVVFLYPTPIGVREGLIQD